MIPTALIPAASRMPALIRAVIVGAVGAVVSSALLVACSGEEAVPIDPANPPVVNAEPPDVTHLIEPTPEMEDLARRQCVDDPSLDQGYVEAVDPNTDRVLSHVTVDCAEVRAGG